MRQNFNDIKDYNCIYKSYSRDGEKERNITFNYHFKKPKLIRMEVIEGGHPGSIIIYNPLKNQNKVALKVGSFIEELYKKIVKGFII